MSSKVKHRLVIDSTERDFLIQLMTDYRNALSMKPAPVTLEDLTASQLGEKIINKLWTMV